MRSEGVIDGLGVRCERSQRGVVGVSECCRDAGRGRAQLGQVEASGPMAGGQAEGTP